MQLILDPFALTNKLLPLKDSDLNNCLVAWPWALLHSNHVIMSAEKACAALQFTLSLFKPIRNNFKGTGDKILQQKEVCTKAGEAPAAAWLRIPCKDAEVQPTFQLIPWIQSGSSSA